MTHKTLCAHRLHQRDESNETLVLLFWAVVETIPIFRSIRRKPVRICFLGPGAITTSAGEHQVTRPAARDLS